MATTLAEVFVTVRPDAKGFGPELRRNLDQVDTQQEGDKQGGKFSGGFGKGLGRLAGAVRTGATLFGGLAVAGGAIGIKTAAGMEQARIGFTTMLGSGKAADTFLQKLSAFAAKTPFEFPELQDAASSLISAGINANKVIPIMTTLGDVTSGMGTGAEGVQRATIALQQMNAAGKISGEDLNQLRDAGIPVYDLLAAATGKSKAEVLKLAQAGKLGKKELDQLMSALESGKGLERFSGLMEKQSHSLTGLASTFHDVFEQGLSTAIQPLIPLIKDGMLVAINLVSAAMPKLATGLASVVQWFMVIRQSFQGAVTDTTGVSDGMALIAIRIGYLARTAGPFLSTIFQTIRGGASDTGGLTSNIAALAIKIGNGLRPAVEFVTGLFKSLVGLFRGGAGTGELSASFTSMGHSLQTLGPVFTQMLGNIRTVGSQMPSLSDGVRTAAAVLKFMADHVNLLIPALGILAGAFVVLKTAQAANEAVGKNSAAGFYISTAASIADTVAKFAQAGANRALAAAIRGSVLSTEADTAATNTNVITRIRNTVATAASRVAQLAAAAASRVMAAGQWLVNAALSANPIGLVVIAIAGLVAAFVLAYRTSSTFRSIVQGAWSGIKSAVAAAWGFIQPVLSSFWTWITKTLMPAITSFWSGTVVPAMRGIGSAVSTMWRSVVLPAVNAFNRFVRGVLGPTVSWIWRNIVSPAFAGISAIIRGVWIAVHAYFSAWDTFIRRVLAPTVTWLWSKVIKPTFSSISSGIQTAWTSISRTFGWLKAGMTAVGTLISNVWTRTIRGTWTSISAGAQTMWTAMSRTFGWIKTGISGVKTAIYNAWAHSGIKSTFDALGTFVKTTLATKFSQGVSAIKTAWDKLGNVAKAPINFMIGTVYDKGLRGLFNKVASVVGSKTRLPYIGGLAGGGPVPMMAGASRHRDSVAAVLQPGEFVVRQDGSNIAEALQHFGAPGYSIGGWISDKVHAIGGAISGAAGKVKATASGVIGWVQGMLGKMAGGVLGNIRGLLGGVGSSPLAGLVKSAGSSLISSLASFITRKDKEAPAGGGGAYTGPIPGGGSVTRWSSTVLSVLATLHQSPSWLSTVLRRLNQESGGNPNAINNWDINAQNGVPSQGLMQVIPPTFAAYAGAFRGLGIRNPFANIYAGLNYAIHRYGSLSALNRPGGYRDGGMLNPGQLGFNETRRPERVLTSRQTEAFERLVDMLGGDGLTGGGNIYVTNHYPVAEPASVTVNRALQLSANLGR